jgi:uncharacterized protein YndB with AHSA1/START domain
VDNQPQTPIAPTTPTWMVSIGWIISLLTVAMMCMSAVMKFMPPTPEMEDGLKHLGWDPNLVLGLGIIEIACAVCYLYPRTAVLGAIFLTGYLGGAVATHVRVGDPLMNCFTPMIVGALVWLGLLLRIASVRALLPMRSDLGPSSIFIKIFVVLVLIVVAFVVAAALQPETFHIERKITIDAPAADVFPYVNDFHKWEQWSPWLEKDPNVAVTYEGPEAGKDAVYKWSGNMNVGEGAMLVTDSQPNELIKIKLDFIKPMPGTSAVEFQFKEEGKKTVVTWKMDGRNNLIAKGFHLVLNMDKMISGKFDDGLAKMKAVVEAKKK